MTITLPAWCRQPQELPKAAQSPKPETERRRDESLCYPQAPRLVYGIHWVAWVSATPLLKTCVVYLEVGVIYSGLGISEGNFLSVLRRLECSRMRPNMHWVVHAHGLTQVLLHFRRA